MKKFYLLLVVSFFSFCSLFAQVGINTESPQNTLHIVGDGIDSPMRIEKLQDMPTGASVNPQAYVVIDENTGELSKGVSATPPFSYITYTLSKVNRDWVKDFDTKIPTDRYTVIIIGHRFDQKLHIVKNGNSYDRQPPLKMYAVPTDPDDFSIPSATWRIKADYDGGNPTDNGTWTIYCLILSKSQVIELKNEAETDGVFRFDLNSQPTGSATSSPIP